MKTKLTLISIFFFTYCFCFAQDENIQEILSIANSGYMAYLDKIPKGQESNYGFKNSDEFALAKIGKPYEIYTLSKEFFSDTNLTENKNYLIPTNEWRMPITVNGENRILLTIAKMNDTYQVVGIGATALAKELGEYESKYPSVNQEGKLLRVYQLECDFFLSSSENNSSVINVYPLTSAKMASDKTNTKTFSSSSYSINQALLIIKNNLINK